MKIKPSQVAATAFMVGYTLFGLICVNLVYTRKNCNSAFYFTADYVSTTTTTTTSTTEDPFLPHWIPEKFGLPAQALFEDRYCAGSLHGFYSSLSMFVFGFAVVIFRVLNGLRTRLVKFIHLGLHILALSLFVVGCYFLFVKEYNVTYDVYRFHAYSAMFVGAMYLMQLFVGLGVFIFQRNQRLRLMFAPFHDIFGIWLIVGLVACTLSGKRFAQSDYKMNNQLAFYCLTFVSYSFVLIVLLNPYFEWDLVGRI